MKEKYYIEISGARAKIGKRVYKRMVSMLLYGLRVDYDEKKVEEKGVVSYILIVPIKAN